MLTSQEEPEKLHKSIVLKIAIYYVIVRSLGSIRDLS